MQFRFCTRRKSVFQVQDGQMFINNMVTLRTATVSDDI